MVRATPWLPGATRQSRRSSGSCRSSRGNHTTMAELTANPRVMKRSPLEIGVDRAAFLYLGPRRGLRCSFPRPPLFSSTRCAALRPQRHQGASPVHRTGDRPVLTGMCFIRFHSCPFWLSLGRDHDLAPPIARRACGSIAEPRYDDAWLFEQRLIERVWSRLARAPTSQWVETCLKRRYRASATEVNKSTTCHACRQSP